MADEPVTLAGLVARSQGVTEAAIDPKKTNFDQLMKLTFDQDATATNPAIDISKDTGLVFSNGNFALGDHKEILQAMQTFGQQVLDQAKKENIDITKLAEFKNLDLHLEAGTKDLTAKDVGAVLLATSLRNSVGQLVGSTSSQFDDKLLKSDMEGLLNPKHAAAVKAIATALLSQNGVKVVEPSSPEQVVTAIGNEGTAPRMRC
jgi:hypothetical protein